MGISATIWGQFKALGYCNPLKAWDLITPICIGLGVTVVSITTATGWYAQDLDLLYKAGQYHWSPH
eukprot:6714892-Ditylum_brightwellii.AAC.1